MASPAAHRYLQDRVLTATPAELVGMVYDIAVRSLVAAGASLGQGDRPGAGRHLLKAQDAVVELRCALEKESRDPAAAELAGQLDSLYEYIYLRLVKASVQGDATKVTECLGLLEPLRQAWREGCLHLPPVPVPTTVASP